MPDFKQLRQNIKAVAVDLDGTSINSKHELEPFTARVYNVLAIHGIKLIVATGRGKTDVPMLDKLFVPYALITYNGSVIAKPESLGYIRPVDPKVTEFLVNYSYPEDIIVSYYSADEWFTNTDNIRLARGITASNKTYNFALPALVLQKPIVKIFLVDLTRRHDRLAAINQDLQAAIGELSDIVFSAPHTLDVTAKEVNKFTAIDYYLSSIGIDAKEELIAFGDSCNDLAMLTRAKYGFYLANTPDFIKEEFKQHPNCFAIGYNHELATAKTLNEIFALGITEEEE